MFSKIILSTKDSCWTEVSPTIFYELMCSLLRLFLNVKLDIFKKAYVVIFFITRKYEFCLEWFYYLFIFMRHDKFTTLLFIFSLFDMNEENNFKYKSEKNTHPCNITIIYQKYFKVSLYSKIYVYIFEMNSVAFLG